jgi:hypothetical protein
MVSMGPSWDQVEYTSFSSPINLEATYGKKIQGIKIVEGSGTVTVRTEGSGDTTRTWTVQVGEEIRCQLRSIESVVDVAKVRVYIGD